MNIVELNHRRKEAWNDFVRSDAHGTFFHLAEWQDVLERAFGFQTFYLINEDGGTVKGILPLALVKRPIFGPALISTPLGVYGGGLGDCAALEAAAIKKAQDLGVEYLELRGSVQTKADIKTSNRFATFRRALSDDHEENLKAIPRKQRAEVRKGIAAGLPTTVNQDIALFYKLYSTSVRNLGTPVFPKKYLHILSELFGEAFDITTISHEGQALTSVLSFKYKDQILPYYGGGVSEARDHSAYPYMYWTVMERAVNNRLRVFDFGRSMNGSGAYAFKKNFGFEPEPLPYHYHLVRAQNMPDMDPDTPRNKMITSVWQKMPLPVANMVGPMLYPVIV